MSQSPVGALVLLTEAAAPAGDKTQQSNHYFNQVNQPVITMWAGGGGFVSGTMFNASKQPLRDIEASMVFSAALSVLLTLVVPISDT